MQLGRRSEEEFWERAEQQSAQDELDQRRRDRETDYGGREALDSEIELAEFATVRQRADYRDVA